LKSGCSSHLKRIFADFLPSNLKHAHTTRFENRGASHSTQCYKDYCARVSGSRDLTQQIGSRKVDVNKIAVPHIKSYL